MDDVAGLGLTTEFTTDLAELEAIAQSIRTAAQHRQGKSLELLAILRLLENLHQEIRDGFFREALPDNRQALYALLRDVELNGGWPYIHRMKLRAFLAQFESAGETAQTEESPVAE